MSEVFFIGEVVGATGFAGSSLFVKYAVAAGPAWRVLEGNISGQTHVDSPADGETAMFSHPLDIHYATKGIQGWPKIQFQVWHLDGFGRSELYGYGFCHLPTTAGTHELECVTWRPTGSLTDQAAAHFIGGGPQLKSPDLVVNSADRYRLRTVAMGSIHLQVAVILRNFDKYGVETE